MMREAIGRAVKATADKRVVRSGWLTEASKWGTAKALHDGLLSRTPFVLVQVSRAILALRAALEARC